MSMRFLCVFCGMQFALPNDRYNHIKAKHGKANAKPFRVVKVTDDEPSEAESAIEATNKQLAGEQLTDVEKAITPK